MRNFKIHCSISRPIRAILFLEDFPRRTDPCTFPKAPQRPALELFDDALAAALRPSPDYDVSRWLYVPNHYSEYRYILGTRGRKPLICMGINPSTAAPDALDPTLQSASGSRFPTGTTAF